MSAEFISTLPNLSIGVISVLALAYISIRHADTQKKSQDAFVKSLDDRSERHERALKDREDALRNLESDVRKGVTAQLTENTVTMRDVAKLLGRVMSHLDGEK